MASNTPSNLSSMQARLRSHVLTRLHAQPAWLTRLYYLPLALFVLLIFFGLRNNAATVLDLVERGNWFGDVATYSRINEPVVDQFWGRIQLIALFLALLCMGLFFVRLRDLLTRYSPAWRFVTWLTNHPALAVSGVVLVVGLAMSFGRQLTIDGIPYYYLDDDAMITMRYARNFAAGLGPVWNAGEYVEGYTNPLWMIIMTLVHMLGVSESNTSLVIMLLNWSLLAATLWVMQDILRRAQVSVFWMLTALLLLLADESVFIWTRSGLEPTLLALLVALCVRALYVRGISIADRLSFLIPLALLPLVRIDAVVLAVTLGLIFLYDAKPARRRAFLLLVLAALPSVLYEVFRLVFYGALLPNTFYLKATFTDSPLILLGFSYILRLLVHYPVLLVLMVMLPFLNPRERLVRVLILVFTAQVAYAVIIGGDIFVGLRFIVPVLPLLYISATLSLQAISKQIPMQSHVAVAALVMVTVPVAVNFGQLFRAPDGKVYEDWFKAAVINGVLLERNTPPGTVVSLDPAGIMPYFAEDLIFVDHLGKSDSHIASLEPIPTNEIIGHNKYDFDYVLGERRPDLVHVVLCYNDWVSEQVRYPREQWDARIASTPSNLPTTWLALVYNDYFLRDYYPNPVTILDDVGNYDGHWPLGCFYRRTDSVITDTTWTFSGKPIDRLIINFDWQAVPGDGWYGSETWGDDVTIRWAGGGSLPESTLVLPLSSAGDLRLEFCMVSPVGANLPDEMWIAANNQRLDVIYSTQGYCGFSQEVSTVKGTAIIPQSALAIYPGKAVLKIGYTPVIPDNVIGNGDTRSLGAAFDWLKITPASANAG